MALRLLTVGVAFALCHSAWAQDPAPGRYPRRSYETAHVGANQIEFDGIPNERAWDGVDWAGDFVQFQPDPGAAPKQPTQFKIVYDDHSLYFGVRAFEPDRSRIESILGRRDQFPGDWVEINIDSYRDFRTGFSFTSSVSGTRGDEFISNDGNNWDGNWNPIWELKTNIDDRGWTLEARIPFSQLRYADGDDQVWGFQVMRRIFREEQRSVFQPKHPEDPGWVSQFAELRGLRGLGSPRRIELVPYGVARGETFAEEAGNPFLDGQSGEASFGLDGKLGVTSDMTLDFMINPDFGQVEADPSQVNLTAFETFFDERRPFFVEGKDIFEWGISPATTGGSFTRDNLFYSRRIGRRPRASVELSDGEYADLPASTSILGAGKLSGKTANGISIGILDAVTAREHADIEGPQGERDAAVEPLTNIMISRLQKDFRNGDTRLGGVLTAVNRQIDEPQLEFLHEEAYAAGADAFHRFHERNWFVAGTLAQSYVAGEPEALLLTQTNSARYYQRPDNAAADVDSARTSLTGTAFAARFGKSAGGRWRFETGITSRTSGFEVNDAGFLQRAGEVYQFGYLGYRISEPIGPFRELSINGNEWLSRNATGFFEEQDETFLTREFNLNSRATTLANWELRASLTRALEFTSNTELRGGPSSRWPGRTNGSFEVSTDGRRQFGIGVGGAALSRDEDAGDFSEVWLDLRLRPTNALTLHFSNFYNQSDTEMQYVQTSAFDSDARYLFGRLEQETYGITARVDYTLSPNLTLQYYGSPFLSSGRYSRYKRITDPKADSYSDRFAEFGDTQIDYDASSGSYDIDEDVDGVVDYSFAAPDFEFREFHSNLVLRWEFEPGSSVFLIWSQARSEVDGGGDLDLNSDLRSLFEVYPHDVFLIKFAKWLSW